MQDTGRQDTRERLFRAAIAVFAARGYRGATVRAICERAGANVAAVNYHFGDKERLYAEVLEHIFRTPRLRRPHGPAPDGLSPEDQLRDYIRTFLHEVYDCIDDQDHCADLASIYLMEMAHPSPGLDHIVETYIRPDAERLEAILRAMLGSDFPPRLRGYCAGAVIAQALHYCNTGPILSRLAPGAPPLRPEGLDALAELAFQFSMGGIERLRAMAAAMAQGEGGA